jgi:hypothetical protein
MRAGVDDFESGCFKGFSCIVISDDGAAKLESRGRVALSSIGLSEFHGSEFDPPRETKAYETFADAIRDSLLVDDAYVAFQLYHQDLSRELFEEFAPRVASQALSQLMNHVPDFVLSKAGALFSFARGLGQITDCSGQIVGVQMDQSQEGDEQAGRERVGLSGTLGAILTDAADALVRLANVYKRQRFPTGPEIGSLRVLDSKGSILVQAADVLANFGMAYVKSRLRTGGGSSYRETEKSRIFASVIPPSPVPTGTLTVTTANVLAGSRNDNIRMEAHAW